MTQVEPQRLHVKTMMRYDIVHTAGMVLNPQLQQTITKLGGRRKTLSWLAGMSLFALVLQLTGCASAGPDETKYNPVTGYPAVGDRPWTSSDSAPISVDLRPV